MDEHKLLDALAGIDFARIEVAVGIGGHLVHPVELAGVAAVVSGLAEDAAIAAQQRPNDVVLAVGDQQELLIAVAREGQLPDRSVAQRFLAQEELLQEFSLLGEHLDAIVHAIADVDQSVVRQVHAMDGIAELLIHRCGG